MYVQRNQRCNTSACMVTALSREAPHTIAIRHVYLICPQVTLRDEIQVLHMQMVQICACAQVRRNWSALRCAQLGYHASFTDQPQEHGASTAPVFEASDVWTAGSSPDHRSVELNAEQRTYPCHRSHCAYTLLVTFPMNCAVDVSVLALDQQM